MTTKIAEATFTIEPRGERIAIVFWSENADDFEFRFTPEQVELLMENLFEAMVRSTPRQPGSSRQAMCMDSEALAERIMIAASLSPALARPDKEATLVLGAALQRALAGFYAKLAVVHDESPEAAAVACHEAGAASAQLAASLVRSAQRGARP